MTESERELVKWREGKDTEIRKISQSVSVSIINTRGHIADITMMDRFLSEAAGAARSLCPFHADSTRPLEMARVFHRESDTVANGTPSAPGDDNHLRQGFQILRRPSRVI